MRVRWTTYSAFRFFLYLQSRHSAQYVLQLKIIYIYIFTFDQALGKPSATTSRKAGTALATRRIQVHSRSRQTRSLHPVLNIYIRVYISTHAGFAYNRPRMNLSGLLYHYSFMHKLKYILADAIPNILVLPKNQVIVGGIWVRQVTGA